jgi:glycerophosphoryl diester phosphodiesterase
MAMIVGHRGARNLWPENSLSGFRKLAAMGVDAVEFDVQQAGDGGLFVIHDPTLERTTERSGAIRALDSSAVGAARLRSTDAGAPDDGECVPTLAQVLDVFAGGSLELHVELKTDAWGKLAAGMIERVADVVRRQGLQERSIVTCFVPQVLLAVRAAWPDVRLLASLDHRSAEMLGGLDAALDVFAALDGCIVAIEKKLLADAWDRCAARLGGDRLGVWVVNEPDDIARWADMPLRQITTDRPDRFVARRTPASR